MGSAQGRGTLGASLASGGAHVLSYLAPLGRRRDARSSTFFLPRLVGLRRALELVLLNPRMSAGDALEMGLVNRVFPDAGFDERVAEIAASLAAGPTHAYAVAKSLIHQAAGVAQLDHHLDEELQALARIADEPDFAEELDAFFEKRSARFGER